MKNENSIVEDGIEWIDVNTAHQMAGITKQAIYDWLRPEKIRSRKIFGKLAVAQKDLERLIKEKKHGQ